jgi:hypothetical protein
MLEAREGHLALVDSLGHAAFSWVSWFFDEGDADRSVLVIRQVEDSFGGLL